MERVSTAGLQAATLQSALALQSRYAEKISEQSSGVVADTVGGLGEKAADFLNLQAEHTNALAYAANASTAYDRTQAAYAAVGSMIDLVSTLRTTLSGAISSTTSLSTLNTLSGSTLASLSSLMNSKYDGIYLFSGSSTDTAPIDLTDYDVSSDWTTSNTSYYQGDDDTAAVRVAADQTVAYGVAGNADAFEQTLRACAAVTNSTLTTADLQQLYDLATSALNNLEGTQGQISVSATRLQQVQEQQTSYATFLENAVSDLQNVDVAAVASKASAYETQLQASYAALASIQKLSLVTYL